eukprot:Rhum_TRINITY_DN14861_c9_g1::Rhum_TRINITY_DN14861_c9_g1_i1::g.124341::m.124341
MPDLRRPTRLGEYELQGLLGKGAYGSVYKAKDGSGEITAVKVISFETVSDLDELLKECRCLRECTHPNIVRYISAKVLARDLCIAMEYLGGGNVAELVRFLHTQRQCRLSEEQVALILREVLQALMYLHKIGHMHRDVKAANILLSIDGNVKVADFGVSRMGKGVTYVGTVNWMAPEVILTAPEIASHRGEGGIGGVIQHDAPDLNATTEAFASSRRADAPASQHYDAKCDVWSLGITAYEIATGQPPYDKQPAKALFQVLDDPPPQLPGDFSMRFRRFVAYCLVKRPPERPPSDKVFRDPFIQEVEGRSVTEALHDVMLQLQERRPAGAASGATPGGGGGGGGG